MSGESVTAPVWVTEIRQAKRTVWLALPDEERGRAIEAQRQWRARKRKARKDKARAKRARIARIVELYFDGRTVDEIGQALGLAGSYVRQLSGMVGFKLLKGPGERDPARVPHVRSVAISKLQERALKQLAAESEQPPGAALSEIVAAALEADGAEARRLMRLSSQRA